MCQMSMKLPAMFDQNPPHTFDKIVKNSMWTPTAVKQYVNPHLTGGRHNEEER